MGTTSTMVIGWQQQLQASRQQAYELGLVVPRLYNPSTTPKTVPVTTFE